MFLSVSFEQVGLFWRPGSALEVMKSNSLQFLLQLGLLSLEWRRELETKLLLH